MCTTTISTLTLNTMLQDPLVRLVMHSDKVSEEDHSQLLFRIQESLMARAEVAEARVQTAA
ncbi:hypothetical protein [Rhodopila sp.]|uniref:hypothetical protein n=1 Tax=Rhodopila sp. TaxID=2480087 RepID=UPI003D110E0B